MEYIYDCALCRELKSFVHGKLSLWDPVWATGEHTYPWCYIKLRTCMVDGDFEMGAKAIRPAYPKCYVAIETAYPGPLWGDISSLSQSSSGMPPSGDASGNQVWQLEN